MIVHAFRLAYFIHDNAEIASQIAAESLIKLKSVAIAQDRRFLYEPSGRSSRNARTRNKITLGELHLLQRIVYHESEPYEREMEKENGTTALDEKRLIIHYLKHLVSITLKRNSFYATLGLTRVLCRYTTTEAMELYNLVVQDPARVKDDYYWRSRKGHLMQDMKERFGDLVTISRGLRGEERFQACDDSPRHAPLVKQCLDMFMPWKTSCPLPPGVGPVSGEIAALNFTGTDPDQEHRIELARMHTVFHLDCVERLLAGLALPVFVERLELPHFFFTQGDDRNSGQNIPPPETTQQTARPMAKLDDSMEPHDLDLSAIERRLDEYEQSRQRAGAPRSTSVTPPEKLRILVDGVERATLEPGRESHVSFDIAEGAEVIEVRTAKTCGQGSDILLATHLLSYDELQRTQRPTQFVTELGRGRKVSFTISSATSINDEPPGVKIEVGYQESTSLLPLRSVWLRLQSWLQPQRASQELVLMRYALPVLLISVTAGAIWLYLARSSDSQSPMIVKNASPTPATILPDAPPPNPAQPLPSTGQAPSGESGGMPKEQGKLPPPTGANTNNTTRDPNATTNVVPLLAVQKIYIELAEGQSFPPALGDQLNKKLLGSRRWTMAGADDADAALMLTATSDGRGIIARLVNEDGRVIWNQRKRVYRGTPEQIAEQIVADLLGAVRQSEKTTDRKR